MDRVNSIFFKVDSLRRAAVAKFCEIVVVMKEVDIGSKLFVM